MVVIHKQTLFPGEQIFVFPSDTKLLYAREQGSYFCLWYVLGTSKITRDFRVVVKMTGEQFETSLGLNYLGSAHLAEGQFVLHAFHDRND